MENSLIASPDLRGLIGPYTEWASEHLHQQFPNLEADHLSFLGAGLVAAGSAIAAWPGERQPKLALALNLGGAATDAFNGVLARVCYGDDPDRLVRGNKIDTLSDFLKDLSMGISKIIVAGRSGNQVNQGLAEVATITTPLASFSRAYKEKQGYKVNEHGNNYLEFIGTRAARTALNAVAASNVSFGGVPLQPPLDGLIIVGNMTRIAKNLALSSREDKSLTSRQKAQFRTKFHAASAAITGTGVLVARKLLN